MGNALSQFLQRVDVLQWFEKVATCYGESCAALETQGINPSDFAMMLAAHAGAVDVNLVSRDKAFAQIPQGSPLQRLSLEVW